jgi:1,4-alpha-glucan branching enzyme
VADWLDLENREVTELFPTDRAEREPLEGMGAMPHDRGTTFRVWAPHADSVSVVGSFNAWAPHAHPLSPEGDGYWAADVDEARPGDAYTYRIVNGDQTLERIDPYAREVTRSDGVGVVHDPSFDWGDGDPFEMVPWNELVIYEMHVGTFHDEPGGEPGDFSSAIEKLPYDEAFEGQVSADVEAEEGGYDGLPHRGRVSLAPYSAIILSQEE